MSRTFEPGVYKGKLADYGMSKTTKDRPQALMVWDVDGKQITWYGLLDPKSSDGVKKAPLEMTVKTLLECGFSGDAIENMAAGKDSNCLTIGTEMDLVIRDNTYINKEGESITNSQIAFINQVGAVGGAPRLTQEEAVAMANPGALRAELMRQRKMASTGASVPKAPL